MHPPPPFLPKNHLFPAKNKKGNPNDQVILKANKNNWSSVNDVKEEPRKSINNKGQQHHIEREKSNHVKRFEMGEHINYSTEIDTFHL